MARNRLLTKQDNVPLVLRLRGGADKPEELSPLPEHQNKKICVRNESPIHDSPIKVYDTDGLDTDLNTVKEQLNHIDRIMEAVAETGKDMKKTKVSSKIASDIENHIIEIKVYVTKIAEIFANCFARVYENRRLVKQTLEDNSKLRVQIAMLKASQGSHIRRNIKDTLADEITFDRNGSPIIAKVQQTYSKVDNVGSPISSRTKTYAQAVNTTINDEKVTMNERVSREKRVNNHKKPEFKKS